MNFVIIGYGGMGSYHAKLVAKLGVGRIVSVYDIDDARQKKAVEAGYKAYVTEDELWSSINDFDAAIVATPNDWHPYYCTKLAEIGKPVICEKPVANSAADFEQMVSVATKNKTVLMVHQNRRWDRDFLIAKQIADSGVIGKIYRIESNVTGANGIPGGWRKIAAKGGGMMLDWGVHLIDQACLFCGKNSSVKNLYADYSYILGFEVEDGFNLNLEFDSGISYNIYVDTNLFVSRPRWVIFGTEGSAEIVDWGYTGKIVVKKDYTEKLAGIKAGNGFTKTMAARPASGTEVFDLPNIEYDEAEFYKNFISTCEGKTQNIVKNSEVMRVMKIMDNAKISASQKKILKDINL